MQSSRITYAANSQNREMLYKQKMEQTGSASLWKHRCLYTFYLTNLLVRKHTLLKSDDCFAFHGGKSINFLKCAVLTHKLYAVLGCLEVKLL